MSTESTIYGKMRENIKARFHAEATAKPAPAVAEKAKWEPDPSRLPPREVPEIPETIKISTEGFREPCYHLNQLPESMTLNPGEVSSTASGDGDLDEQHEADVPLAASTGPRPF